MIMDFVHLHNHTDYSILDGAITVDKLIKKAVEFKMPAVAMTDHGNMYGAIEFYQKAKKNGIKPIIGQEFYLASGSRFKKELTGDKDQDKSNHLLILAKNKEGYQNLMKLSSIGFTEGFYYKPRIDFEVLEKYSEGLMAGSACLAGQIPRAILKGDNKRAREIAGQYNEIFGQDHFYLELQDHGLKEQKTVNQELVKIASELKIPLIATNDAHYLEKEDAFPHEVLLSIQTSTNLDDPKRMRFNSNQFYFKSPQEMESLFASYPDALYNTCKIAEMVDLELELGKNILPNFTVPPGYTLDTYLKHLVNQGAKLRYGENLSGEIKKRIEYELSIILKMNFSGYFLIVWDFIKYAKEAGIAVGPGRGSAAGSIVSYCLGITALDPLKYNLLFERFLNPDRNEMPDMDLDFCAKRREEVIDYVKAKYGEDHVSQIITFNKMKAKAVVKDVARALNIPFARANEISKLIEENTLQESLKASPDFKKLHQDPLEGKKLIDISLKLEGLARSAGKHAAGIVISRGPLTDHVPLYVDPKEGGVSTQFEKNSLEQAGLVKMDFLGLRNLTIIEKCLELIKESRGEEIDLENLSLDDSKTFKLFQKADTKGVFQLESSGMQNLLKKLKPTSFEDIIALVALYRPGPLGSGMADDFIKRKRNPKSISYPHKLLEPILKDTLGVVVYQEQVMLISQVMGNFTLPEADMLRKAMGKKKMYIIDELEEKFLKGAAANKIDSSLAEDVYAMIKKFGEYGFNKSHSAAYALVTYQTAYLKAHFRLEYMAALLSAQPDKQSDIIQYINDCRSQNIEVLPPSINKSKYNFTIEGDSIRFGFGAIKGLGEKAVEVIVAQREEGGYKNLKDFLERVSSLAVNKGVLEALIKSGALDEFNHSRAQLFDSINFLITMAKKLQADRETGQGNLFASGQNGFNNEEVLDLPFREEWVDKEKLAHEKEILGLYLSGHPLGKYEQDIKIFSAYSLNRLTSSQNGKKVSILGLVSGFKMQRSKKGNLFGTAILEDLENSVELLFFSKIIESSQNLITSEEPVLITGSLEIEGDSPKKIICQKIDLFKNIKKKKITGLHFEFNPFELDDLVLNDLKEILKQNKGDRSVFFHLKQPKGEKIVKAHSNFNINPTEKLYKDLTSLVGQEAIRYSIRV